MATVMLVTVVGSYLALCGLVYAKQRLLVFPGPKVRGDIAGKSVFVDVPGGTYLLWRDAGGAGPVVVHFHGNGEQVAHLSWLAEAYAARGVSFAAVEYPGYAGAAGEAGEASLVEAGRNALELLTGKLGVARERLVLSGQSVGTGLAVTLAEQGWGTRLLLLTPYTSLPDVAAKMLPWLPVRLLMKDRFDSASRAPGIKVPVLIIHGTADEVINYEFGRTLSTRFPTVKLLTVEGGHHNDLWDAPPTLPAVLQFVTGS
jgi:fermentation-respiration switch protein FrsA (DUF1100 family)